MEQSTLVHEALGEHIFEWFLRNKRSEWRAYKTHVSAFEHRPLPESVVAGRDGTQTGRVFPIRRRPTWLARSTSVATGGRRSASAEEAAAHEPPTGWAGGNRGLRRPIPRAPGRSAARCASATCRHPAARCSSPARSSTELELRDDLFDDFCLTPFHPTEVEARLRHLLWQGVGGRPTTRLVEYSGAGAQPRDVPGLDRRAGRST